MIKQILLVGMGGGLGSALRYLTSLWTEPYNTGLFPLATFTVNILGCLFMGLLLGVFGQYTQEYQSLRLLLVTGFCGGYTTFSAFASENINLLEHHHFGTAVLYTLSSILIGCLAIGLGFFLMKQL